MTIDRQQIVDGFSILMNLLRKSDLDAFEEKFEQVVHILSTRATHPDGFLKYIPELIDPNYGIGYQVPDRFELEMENFCALLQFGVWQSPISIMPYTIELVAALDEDNEVEELYSLSMAQINAIASAGDLCLACFSEQDSHIVRPDENVVVAICKAIQQLLSIHRDEGGETAMLSALGHIADRLVVLLN